MVTVDEVIDEVNALDAWAQWSVGAGLTLLTLLIVRFLMKKVILDFVKATKFTWDDQLYRPVTQRLYSFIFFVGTQLTMLWVMGREHELNEALDPVFSAIYILLTTSLASVALKIMVPVVIEKFSNPGTVTVSGSNSLVVFLLRGAVCRRHRCRRDLRKVGRTVLCGGSGCCRAAWVSLRAKSGGVSCCFSLFLIDFQLFSYDFH